MRLVIEKDIETYLVKRVESLGGKCLKFPAEYNEGIPDRLVILPKGNIAFTELKRPKGGRLSEMQKYQHKKLRALGCKVYVVKTKEEADEMLKELLSNGVQASRVSGDGD